MKHNSKIKKNSEKQLNSFVKMIKYFLAFREFFMSLLLLIITGCLIFSYILQEGKPINVDYTSFTGQPYPKSTQLNILTIEIIGKDFENVSLKMFFNPDYRAYISKGKISDVSFSNDNNISFLPMTYFYTKDGVVWLNQFNTQMRGNNFAFPFDIYQLFISPDISFTNTSKQSNNPTYNFISFGDKTSPALAIRYRTVFNNTYQVDGFLVTKETSILSPKDLGKIPVNTFYIQVYHPWWYKFFIILICIFLALPIVIFSRKTNNPGCFEFFSFLLFLAAVRAWWFGITLEIHALDLYLLMLVLFTAILILNSSAEKAYK